jgi:hypothetical protein
MSVCPAVSEIRVDTGKYKWHNELGTCVRVSEVHERGTLGVAGEVGMSWGPDTRTQGFKFFMHNDLGVSASISDTSGHADINGRTVVAFMTWGSSKAASRDNTVVPGPWLRCSAVVLHTINPATGVATTRPPSLVTRSPTSQRSLPSRRGGDPGEERPPVVFYGRAGAYLLQPGTVNLLTVNG